MCKVRGLVFTCGHFAKIRLSGCGGSFHRVRRTGESVACSADPYFWMTISADCVWCQLGQLESSRKQRLERASLFLTRIKLQGKAGAERIQVLIDDMRQKHEQESWAVSRISTTTSKGYLGKVKMSTRRNRQRQGSLLQREVQPEDLVQEGMIKDELNMEPDPDTEEFYTPIDYNHPWDRVNNSDWTDTDTTKTSEGDECTTQEEAMEGFDSGAWYSDIEAWGQSSTVHADTAQPSWHILDDSTLSNDNKPQSSKAGNTTLTAWGPSADYTTSTGTIGFEGLKISKADPPDEINEIIDKFWKFVDDEPEAHNHQHATTSEDALPSQFRSFENTLQTQDQDQEHPPTGPIWADGPCEIFLSPECLFPSSDTISNEVQRTVQIPKYNKMRAQLLAGDLKTTDPKGFYTKWLTVCRWEAQHLENSWGHGRKVPCPR